MTYTARISQIFTYRITFNKGDYDTDRYKFLDSWPEDIVITTSSTAFNPPIVMPSMRLVWKNDDGDYSWKYNYFLNFFLILMAHLKSLIL